MCRRLVPLSLAVALACDANLGAVLPQETGDSSTAGDSTTGDGDPGEAIACVAGQLCPDGRQCQNGVCLLECGGDEECSGDDYYCGKDNLCHSTMVPTCNVDTDCEVTQICRNQICTTTASCTPYEYMQEGCASNAVCIEDFDTEQTNCYQMPACDPGGTCPIGTEGAVCNTGYLPSKDEICLIGLCDTVAHCPAQWSCVRYNNEVLGACSSGAFGSPCSEPEHCLSEVCVPLPGLGGGLCQ